MGVAEGGRLGACGAEGAEGLSNKVVEQRISKGLRVEDPRFRARYSLGLSIQGRPCEGAWVQAWLLGLKLGTEPKGHTTKGPHNKRATQQKGTKRRATQPKGPHERKATQTKGHWTTDSHLPGAQRKQHIARCETGLQIHTFLVHSANNTLQ
eukprot:353294-Chlamydomonas_euryale.AAC.1